MPSSKSSARKTPSNNFQQRLVDIALQLIEKNNGCRGVNLRQIAARARCAHTNVYNYFDSLESLFWAALDRALERLIAHSRSRLQTPAAKKAPLRTFLEAQVDYSLDHPAHYRLFWLEPLAGKPSTQVLARLDEMRTFWTNLIGGEVIAKSRRTLSQAELTQAGQMIHGYFHGEMCKLVSRQEFVGASKDAKKRIVGNTLALVEIIGAAKPATA